MILTFKVVHTFAGDFDSMFELVATIIICLVALSLCIAMVLYMLNPIGSEREEQKNQKQKQNKKAS